MIYTLTISASLDYYIKLDNLKLGSINRSNSEYIEIGGKGINVSKILKEHNIDNTAILFTAGFTGNKIKEELSNLGINYYNINSIGMNRINVKILGKEETSINTNGIIITDDEVSRLVDYLSILKSGDFLILSGNLPSSVDYNIYNRILESVKNKDIKVILDAEKELLKNTLIYKPWLIKPNLEELEWFSKRNLNKIDDIYLEACKLIDMGAQNILLSLGSMGVMYIKTDKSYIYKEALRARVISTTGAGDSLLGGFLSGIYKGLSLTDAIDLGQLSAKHKIEMKK